MSKDHGGPAFPTHTNPRPGHLADAPQGMSLRDYFAAKFAAAQVTATSADSGFINPDYIDPRGEETVAEKVARTSYAMADAMLAARGGS
ncbi:hypothetical protein NRB16_07885 [Pseudomonas sp. LJDD11]|uniref:hypothetical protein n=1 Tax=Pseudomonas sp. LJDD11 TaxID=2931984 RepID=UPI00211C8E72|nr:hypothetical protein [Pseudomonas sp. LJDD11]MCQ9423439.1 hypothetical protein [Pseudomonas sp. LJDD11]